MTEHDYEEQYLKQRVFILMATFCLVFYPYSVTRLSLQKGTTRLYLNVSIV